MWTCLLLSRRESKEGLDRPEGRPFGESAGLRASPLCAGEVCRQRGALQSPDPASIIRMGRLGLWLAYIPS